MEVLRKAFKRRLDPTVSKFVSSVKADEALIDVDIAGSIAHVKMQETTGLLTAEQAQKLTAGLRELRLRYKSGELKLDPAYEDVHMNVEKKLEELIGDDALRLHTARSRNDQVALDLRLFTLQKIDEIDLLILELQEKLLDCAEKNIDAVMPGYTHLQRAQPILFAHALHAFFTLLARDRQRFRDARTRTAVSPLGAGAQAGSALPIDPFISAKELALPAVFANSIDAVGDRDFVAEFLFAASLTAIHLSQMAETFIIWCTKEFGFAEFGDSVTTSSSLMPQKKNPDPLEIIRGKAGNTVGELVNLLITLKGLPLGYNRDLQETKPPVINTAKSLSDCLRVMSIVIGELTIKTTTCELAASDPDLFATDMVEYLVLKGLPFRKAHDCVAELISHCRDINAPLDGLTIAQYKQFAPQFDKDVADIFKAGKSVIAKKSYGSTGSDQVKKAIAQARQSLKQS